MRITRFLTGKQADPCINSRTSSKISALNPRSQQKSQRLGAGCMRSEFSYYGRTYAEVNKIDWKDGVWAILVHHNVQRTAVSRC
jgi:hypothetical protein